MPKPAMYSTSIAPPKAGLSPFSWLDLGIVLSKRKLWGIYLGQFCLNSTLWFFLVVLPNLRKGLMVALLLSFSFLFGEFVFANILVGTRVFRFRPARTPA